MGNNKNLIDINDTKSILELLSSPLKLAEALTGLLISDSDTRKLSAGKLIQAAIKHKFFTQLGKEIQEYIKKGQIKEDYLATHKTQVALHELLKFIDEEIPDEERFCAMKSIFLFSVSKDTAEKDKELAYELLKICKKLGSGELLILKAAYDIANGKANFEYHIKFDEVHGAAEWLDLVSKQIGHNISSLVEVYEENLANLKLIGARSGLDKSAIKERKNFRLTPLGYKLCEFISKYP